MREGYEIQIQSDLPRDVKAEATRWALQWGEAHKDGYGAGKTATSERRTYFNRGVLGATLDDLPSFAFDDSNLVFRRISRNRRVFGIVHINTMERIDGEPILLDQCRCPQHRGGQRVRFKERPTMESVFTWGEVKG